MIPTTNSPTPAPSPVTQWPNPDFAKHIAEVPQAELLRWANRHVAWSWDGTRIITGAETLSGLIDELHRLGIDTSSVVFDYIELPDAAGG